MALKASLVALALCLLLVLPARAAYDCVGEKEGVPKPKTGEIVPWKPKVGVPEPNGTLLKKTRVSVRGAENIAMACQEACDAAAMCVAYAARRDRYCLLYKKLTHKNKPYTTKHWRNTYRSCVKSAAN